MLKSGIFHNGEISESERTPSRRCKASLDKNQKGEDRSKHSALEISKHLTEKLGLTLGLHWLNQCWKNSDTQHFVISLPPDVCILTTAQKTQIFGKKRGDYFLALINLKMRRLRWQSDGDQVHRNNEM